MTKAVQTVSNGILRVASLLFQLTGHNQLTSVGHLMEDAGFAEAREVQDVAEAAELAETVQEAAAGSAEDAAARFPRFRAIVRNPLFPLGILFAEDSKLG